MNWTTAATRCNDKSILSYFVENHCRTTLYLGLKLTRPVFDDELRQFLENARSKRLWKFKAWIRNKRNPPNSGNSR
ncbi:hypothetical protein CRE_08393 [Caenorhabditis remanei]|uniref:Uncharacterized protein n=1 Tax=Caenorhabditis remanei TaxID=31234 RepID=E3MPH9_CAERE|nr:hypothetical protein CRE_08393 [Caenorhabditis remanei]